MTTSSSETHEATTDPSGLAIRCSCGNWAMLYRNSIGVDAETAHRQHRESMLATATAPPARSDWYCCEQCERGGAGAVDALDGAS